MRDGEKGTTDFLGEVLKPGGRMTLLLFVAVDVTLVRVAEAVPNPGNSIALFVRVVGSLELVVNLGSPDALVSMSSILSEIAVVQK